jgi:hypothetical protein
VTVTPTYYAQSAKLVIANSASVQAAVRVIVTGQDATANRSQTIVQTSADSFWTAREGRTRKVSGNRWIQTAGQANMLKAFLADRQETPTLVAKLRGKIETAPGGPRKIHALRSVGYVFVGFDGAATSPDAAALTEPEGD